MSVSTDNYKFNLARTFVSLYIGLIYRMPIQLTDAVSLLT